MIYCTNILTNIYLYIYRVFTKKHSHSIFLGHPVYNKFSVLKEKKIMSLIVTCSSLLSSFMINKSKKLTVSKRGIFGISKIPHFYTHTLKSENPYTGSCVVKRSKDQRTNMQDRQMI